MRNLVLIQFTKDTATRKAGTRLKVDAGSATSFCDKLKVATRVSDSPAAPPVQPAAVVVDAEPEAIPPADVDADY